MEPLRKISQFGKESVGKSVLAGFFVVRMLAIVGGISLAFCGLLGNFIMRLFELVKYLIWYLMAVSTVLAEKSVHKSGE